MSKQEDFGRPEKPLEKTREIDNEARISKKIEMKRKFNRNQKRITLWDIQLSSLTSLVYINDLPERLTTSAKLFADDTSLFSVVHDYTASTAFLNEDLLKNSRWANQWKMIFNPDVSKQAQEIVFSRKANAGNHKTVYFNNVPVIRKNIQKHLGLFLDSKLSFLWSNKRKN